MIKEKSEKKAQMLKSQ